MENFRANRHRNPTKTILITLYLGGISMRHRCLSCVCFSFFFENSDDVSNVSFWIYYVLSSSQFTTHENISMEEQPILMHFNEWHFEWVKIITMWWMKLMLNSHIVSWYYWKKCPFRWNSLEKFDFYRIAQWCMESAKY